MVVILELPMKSTTGLIKEAFLARLRISFSLSHRPFIPSQPLDMSMSDEGEGSSEVSAPDGDMVWQGSKRRGKAAQKQVVDEDVDVEDVEEEGEVDDDGEPELDLEEGVEDEEPEEEDAQSAVDDDEDPSPPPNPKPRLKIKLRLPAASSSASPAPSDIPTTSSLAKSTCSRRESLVLSP